MMTTFLFVALQYLLGVFFTIAGMSVYNDKVDASLDSIIPSILTGFACMLAGVVLAGYFHLRARRITYKFGAAIALSLAGMILFFVLYALVQSFLPRSLDMLLFLLPLTGAVFGFNLVATLATGRQQQ